MEERLRTACPCLETLWQRIFSDKKTPATAESEGGGGGSGSVVTASEPEAGRDSGEIRAASPAVVDPAPGSSSLYTALWGFESRHPDELSFQEGDLFNVSSRAGEWWTARRIDRNGRVLDSGIVPSNYLVRAEALHTQPWFFGTMSHSNAQSCLLIPENEQGAFLIRQSEKDNVGYVLSVRSVDRVKHYRIFQEGETDFYVERAHHFSSLIDLVEHYCANSLGNNSRLGKPCKRKKPNTSDLSHSTVDEWERPKEEFTLEEVLGSGYFADVHRGCWKNLIKVAIKVIKSDTELDHYEFQREVQVLKSLCHGHRHLISLFAVCTTSPPYWIITELMEKGSLLHFLRGPEGNSQDMAALVDMSAQVADGMSYLEEKNHIHRDLAARNVLVGEDYVCKVADFGLARVIKESIYVTDNKKIPYKWSAPEAISHGKFSNKSDVWSFGVLLYEITTYGGIPYPGLSNQEVFLQVTKGYRMPAPAKCPDFLYKIMQSCWSEDPADRPDFKSLKAQLDSSFYEMTDS